MVFSPRSISRKCTDNGAIFFATQFITQFANQIEPRSVKISDRFTVHNHWPQLLNAQRGTFDYINAFAQHSAAAILLNGSE